jgi:hypothetical protein
MSGILDLALEPLAEVIMYLNTHEWTKVWLCGDLKLQWKMGKGKAVRNMVIKWNETSKRVWPSQIIHLDGLQSFSYICPSRGPDEHFSVLHLSTLSSNLKKLVLVGDWCVKAFEQLCSANRYHFRKLETLSLSYYKHIDRIEFEIPRTVTDLAINACCPATSKGSNMALSLLPPHLTRLAYRDLSFESGGFRFPSTLQSLELQWGTYEWPNLQLLPPGICHISVNPFFRQVDTVSHIDDDWTTISTFSNLKSLRIPFNDDFDVPEALLIPRSLERLDFDAMEDLPEEAWYLRVMDALPPNLTWLGWKWPEPITTPIAQKIPRKNRILGASVESEAVSYLPDSLIELFVEEGDYSVISRLPSNLKTLWLRDSCLSLLEKMPRSLETLSLEEGARLSSEQISKIPRDLRSLIIGHGFEPTDDIELFFRELPPNLMSLDVFPEEADCDHRIPLPSPPSSSQYLPRCMNFLKAGFLGFAAEDAMSSWVLGLPSRLITLKIGVDRLQMGVFTSIGILSVLRDLQIKVLHSQPGGWSKYLDFQSLPHSLIRIALRDMEDGESDMTNDDFTGAPPKLGFIDLPKSPLVTKDCLCHFPVLRKLHLGLKTPRWFR